jgi:Protein tyrosine and serine/threonine kinase
MADSTAIPNLRALEDTYRIVGELRASGSTRRLVAQRNDDGAAVMITVVAPSAEAQNNELSHYAADAKLLASLQHPSVLPVLDGRWLGDSFAIVTERASGTTLQDELDRHAEFRNPRIAMILQDIWSGIEAAREQGVVHRWVTPDSVYFDPSSKRPVVALSPAPIPITGVPGPAADARTIGTLAWAMLTGAAFDPKSKAKLAALEPNLATRVVETVEGMLRMRDDGPVPDVPTALGIIAAGDVLKQGEIEIHAMKEEYEELHRLELEKCESHRMETEQYAAEQASLIKDERTVLDRLAAEQSAALAAERAEFEKLMAAREQRIVELRRDLEREATRVARGVNVDEAEATVPERSTTRDPRSFAPTALATVILGLILLGVLVHERLPRASSAPGVPVGRSIVVPTMPSVDTTRLKPGGFMSQNAAGNVASSPSSGPPLATARDSSARAARDSSAADSLAHQQRESTGETIPRHRPKPKDSANDINGMIPPAPDTLVPRPDTFVPRPDTVRRDTVGRPDTMFPRDTFQRRDTFPRRDTAIPRDTLTRSGSTVPVPNVRVETTYVRGTVTRDTLVRPPRP